LEVVVTKYFLLLSLKRNFCMREREREKSNLEEMAFKDMYCHGNVDANR